MTVCVSMVIIKILFYITDSLFNMTGAKSGCSSDNLKEYKLKKSIKDKAKANELGRIFVLVFQYFYCMLN